jgi:hypothetical protein
VTKERKWRKKKKKKKTRKQKVCCVEFEPQSLKTASFESNALSTRQPSLTGNVCLNSSFI